MMQNVMEHFGNHTLGLSHALVGFCIPSFNAMLTARH
jgi:hypothetical protein